jgi:hypothetical protein
MNNLKEGFEVGDLSRVLVPKLHIDEFCSKIGKDDNIAVISFLINDKQAGIDLVDFFERGYDFLLDADISESEIKPGSYLVFVEVLRRFRLIEQIFKLISDLSASSLLNINDWSFKYMDDEDYHKLNKQNLKSCVPLYPRAYRERFNKPITEIQTLAGIQTESIIAQDNLIQSLMHAAGIDNIPHKNN